MSSSPSILPTHHNPPTVAAYVPPHQRSRQNSISGAAGSPRLVAADAAPRKELFSCYATTPLYALDWSRRPGRDAFRLAFGSFTESYHNKMHIARLQTRPLNAPLDFAGGVGPGDQELVVSAEHDQRYPMTRIRWHPYRGGRGPDLLASTANNLKLWEVKQNDQGQDRLVLLSEMHTSKAETAAPLTSFDWCETDNSLLVTCSIDTTCTVWNIETKQAKTQLIAHDREVFDVAWIAGTSDIFSSVGADGSVRMFDLRALDHSSIIYETPASDASASSLPLLRIAANKMDANYLACFHLNSTSVQILDVRLPGSPVSELKAHAALVNGIAWAPNSSSHICSVSDDAQVLVWDVRSQNHSQSTASRSRSAPVGLGTIREPILAYTAPSEVHQVAWSPVMTDWISIVCGKTVQAARVQ